MDLQGYGPDERPSASRNRQYRFVRPVLGLYRGGGSRPESVTHTRSRECLVLTKGAEPNDLRFANLFIIGGTRAPLNFRATTSPDDVGATEPSRYPGSLNS